VKEIEIGNPRAKAGIPADAIPNLSVQVTARAEPF
jgi:hypothetical protein